MRARFLPLFLLLSTVAGAQTYTETILHSFGSSTSDGTYPEGGMVMDSAGNLYGTTTYGGGTSCACGTAFKLSPNGTETILHIFTGKPDGALPLASLAIDKDGNLYGTTQVGGSYSLGTVFKITAAGKYSVLHSFGKTASDGEYPYGPVIVDASGNLYGTTSAGGSTSTYCTTEESFDGCGTIFKVTSAGGESVLYKFTGKNDGDFPTGNLLRDGKGNLYGINGAGLNSVYGVDEGVLFEVTSKGVETTLYTFLAQPDFRYNGTYVARNSNGNFYVGFGNGDCGVSEVTGSGAESDYYFCVGCSSTSPSGYRLEGPLMFSAENLYGTTYEGGANGVGVVYEFAPTSGVETVLYSFGSSSTDGANPEAGVITDSAGNLYGTTNVGGAHGLGTVFKLTKN